MTATINWVINALDCYPQAEGHTDVVITAYWRCTGQQVDSTQTPPKVYMSDAYGACSFSLDPTTPFTPYQDLTQDQVLGWCWSSGVDKDATEAAIQAQVAELVNPPIVQPPLPWAQA